MLTGTELGAAIEAARIKKGVSKAALAAAFGVKPPSVQDWVKRGTIDKEKLPELWRYFADVVGPDHWGLAPWTETHHPLEGAHAGAPGAHVLSHPKFQSGPIALQQVPVIGTLSMGADNMHELRAAPDGQAIGTVPARAATENSYAVQVFGDELYPAVRHGTCLVVDPGGQCIEGELLLLENTDGYFLVCELVADRDGAVTWVPATGGSRRTTARAQVAAMHPIVDMVPGSRFLPAT